MPERTAYKWASSDTFKAMVARVRADLVNRTVGRLVTLSTAHVHNLDRIARDEAESGAVRVAASRAVLANLIELQNHADLAARVAELEKAARS